MVSKVGLSIIAISPCEARSLRARNGPFPGPAGAGRRVYGSRRGPRFRVVADRIAVCISREGPLELTGSPSS
jgi:hypothetical protein